MSCENEYVQPVEEIRKVEGKVDEAQPNLDTTDQAIKELE